MAKKWAELQPRDGDVVMWCTHDDPRYHFFNSKTPLVFFRPDGSAGRCNWIVVCDLCFIAAGGDPQKFEIRGDAVWQGNAPVVKKLEPGD